MFTNHGVNVTDLDIARAINAESARTDGAYSVEVQEQSGAWSWWNSSPTLAGARSIARRYAKHPDRAVRVVASDGRVVWGTP